MFNDRTEWDGIKTFLIDKTLAVIGKLIPFRLTIK